MKGWVVEKEEKISGLRDTLQISIYVFGLISGI